MYQQRKILFLVGILVCPFYLLVYKKQKAQWGVANKAGTRAYTCQWGHSDRGTQIMNPVRCVEMVKRFNQMHNHQANRGLQTGMNFRH